MKLLGLVIILVIINYSASQRTTLWLLADQQITSVTKSYQACTAVAVGTILTSTNSYVKIEMLAVATAGTSAFKIVTEFKFTFTHSDGSVFSYDVNDPTKGLTSTFGSNGPSTIYNSAGSVWLTIKLGNTIYYTATSFSTAQIITDYNSNSTISLIQYTDGAATASAYSVIIRTASGQLTSATGTLIDGCTARAAGRKKRAITTCSGLSGSTESSLNSTTFSSVCTAATAAATNLQYSVAATVVPMNALKSSDAAIFGGAGSKFAITSSFGILIAMSSIIFSLLH